MDATRSEQPLRLCPVCATETTEARCPADGTATIMAAGGRRDARAYAPGDIINDRYEIVSTLGRGGFATVYQAKHTGTGQLVAIKMLAVDQATTGDDVSRRFYREARVTASLTSQHTVRVFDVGQAQDGPLFLVMELLRGAALDAVLRPVEAGGKHMTESAVIDIGVAILNSLAEAHSAGLVHRDLKPSNIMLTRVGDGESVVKVLDFGIAQVEKASPLTAAGKALGTPAFMSPEQISGQPMDGRSDLYALGVLMFRCLSGRLPFDALTSLSLAQLHLTVAPPDVRSIEPSVSAGMTACLYRALQKAPADRYKDARDMRRALEEGRAGRWPDEAEPFAPPVANAPVLPPLSIGDFVDDDDHSDGDGDDGDDVTAELDADLYGDHATTARDVAPSTAASGGAPPPTRMAPAYTEAAYETQTQTAFVETVAPVPTAPVAPVQELDVLPTMIATAYDPADFDAKPTGLAASTAAPPAARPVAKPNSQLPAGRADDPADELGRMVAEVKAADRADAALDKQAMRTLVKGFDTSIVQRPRPAERRAGDHARASGRGLDGAGQPTGAPTLPLGKRSVGVPPISGGRRARLAAVEDAQDNSLMRLVVLGVGAGVALLLLLGAGVGAYAWLAAPDPDEVAGAAEPGAGQSGGGFGSTRPAAPRPKTAAELAQEEEDRRAEAEDERRRIAKRARLRKLRREAKARAAKARAAKAAAAAAAAQALAAGGPDAGKASPGDELVIGDEPARAQNGAPAGGAKRRKEQVESRASSSAQRRARKPRRRLGRTRRRPRPAPKKSQNATTFLDL